MTHYQLVSHNKAKSLVVVASFLAFVAAAAYLMVQGFGYGLETVGWALVFAGLTSFGSYYFSDRIILGLSGARPATRQEFFDFYTVTENLCRSQRMPVPKLFVIDDTALNAFATGRNPQHAVVCATTGLLQRLDRAEIEGVVAHELSHIKNYDILLMSLVTILVGFVALLADWLLRLRHWGGGRRRSDGEGQLQAVLLIAGVILALLSPLIAQLIQLAISRKREFLADASGVAMTKNPQGLIRALMKLGQDREPLEAANKATAHLYITNPLHHLHNEVSWFAQLFATHPPLAERVKALTSLV